MENVTPGTYAVTGYAPGMVRLRGTVEVRVGEESQVQFTLQPALLVRLEVWFPTGREAGNSMTRITDPDGAVLWESDRSHGEVPPRPHKVSAYVPRGQWTVTVTTDTGLAGTTKFDVDSVDGGGRLVRVDLN